MHIIMMADGHELDSFKGYLKKKANTHKTEYVERCGNLDVKEIRFFDLRIPEEIKEDFIKDLMFFWNEKFMRIGSLFKKVIPFIPSFDKSLIPLEPFDHEAWQKKHGKKGGRTEADMIKGMPDGFPHGMGAVKLGIVGIMSDMKPGKSGQMKEVL